MNGTVDADSRSPESVATSVIAVEGRERVDLENGVVGGNGLEGDVGVPVGATCTLQVSCISRDVISVENLRRKLRPVSARCSIFAAPYGRDDTDLVAELRGLLGDWVYVQLRRLRLAGQLAKLRSELLLLSDGQVLITEEDNATLRN